ncbi:MAG TPA: trypsin-like peptidase domain-containing protein [Steroidobacteraceae bacterium]|jgi:serine protease DegS|nr:trypsin-like peptidase domain-containing protein [Steroidobacteraceae bacterium]
MSTRPFLRFLAFVSASAIVGLAAAFVAVVVRPELIAKRTPAPAPVMQPQTTTPAKSPPPVVLTPNVVENLPHAVNSYAEAVERAAPAVVNIYTARLVTERIRPNAIEELFGDTSPRIRQRLEQSLGSGVIVDSVGHVITNHHVIATADLIRAQLADGRMADAKIVGRDPDTDLAVLQLDLHKDLPVMPLGHSDLLRVGDIVLAIGNPVGLSQSVTQGIVSATGRGQLGVATFENFIQTDAPINVGNSGGALINADGELVGINTAVLGKSLGVEGIGFAIPVNLVRGVMSEILSKGRVIRGWIGIVPTDIDQIEARRFNLAQPGVVIAKLYEDSPAAAVGMEPRDIILTVNGASVTSAQDTLTRIAKAKPGAKITITGIRGTERFSSVVLVSERPRGPG